MTDSGDESDATGTGGDDTPRPESAQTTPGPDTHPADPSGESGADERDASGESGDVPAAVDDERIGVEQDLNGRVRYLWIVGSAIGAIFLGVGATLVAHFVFDQYRWGGAVLVAMLVVIGVVRAVLLYRSWHYVVREDSLFLHRGVLTRVQTVAPYVRVQHIDTRRSPLERVVGLSTLVVYTAGSRGADVTIPGLTPDRAADLQERLKRLAIESEEEDAV